MRRSRALAVAVLAMSIIAPSAVRAQSPGPSPAASAGAVVDLPIGCAAFGEAPAQTASVEVPVGGSLVLTLCSNPSTGYTWTDP